ncbi:MAG: putative ABC transport system permease protein [Flavobacteriales bacterium]|jgi:putative ABC transport system permease protein
MFQYYIKLAWLSIKKTPVLTALMVLAIGVGIASCISTYTIFSLISHNPLAHKNDSLYAIQLDSWKKNEAFFNFNSVPTMLAFKDAKTLYQSRPVDDVLLMMKAGVTASPPDDLRNKITEKTRLVTNEFFSMFDVRFIYGKPWDDNSDDQAEEIIVISEGLNARFFNGEDSVGQVILIEKVPFTIVGVVSDSWRLFPSVYDMNNTAYETPPQLYIPFFNLEKYDYQNWGNTQGWDEDEVINTRADFLQSNITWVQMWASLENTSDQQLFRSYLESFVKQENKIGRYQRPMNVLMNPPSEWLKIFGVVGSDAYVVLIMSFSFLLVCLVNSIVLLLAKFYRKAPEAGIRRALGATQQAIFIQHLAEAFIVAFMGGMLVIVLSFFGIAGIAQLYQEYKGVASLNLDSLMTATVLVFVSTLVSGILPAYKISRTEPARYLKTQ